jgi:hypothetical protein
LAQTIEIPLFEMHDVIQNLGLKNREMDKLIEEFSHSIYGLNF